MNKIEVPAESIAERLQFRQVEESDLIALEWDGEYRHFRRLFQEIYLSTLLGNAMMWLVEMPDAGVIGQIFIQLHSGRLDVADGKHRVYLFAFRIKPPYRNMGIGSQFLAHVEEDLFRRGVRWITLNVGKQNRDARRFYERHAYVLVGSEPGNWSYADEFGCKYEVQEPAWRMQKILIKQENL